MAEKSIARRWGTAQSGTIKAEAMMRAERKALGLIQLAVVLLSAQLDAFALAPAGGRVNAAPRSSSRPPALVGAAAAPFGPSAGAGVGAARVVTSTSSQAEIVAISGGGGGKVRTSMPSWI